MSALHLGDSSSNDLVNFTTCTMRKGRNHWILWNFVPSDRQTSTQQREKQYRWLNVLQQLNRAALALQQCLGTVHDLPDNLLQVSLFLKQVIDYLQERLNTSDGKKTPLTLVQQCKPHAPAKLTKWEICQQVIVRSLTVLPRCWKLIIILKP